MKIIFTVFFLFSFGFFSKAQSIIWTGAVNNDFNNAGNWSTGVVPTATDNVSITILSSKTITLSANTSINNLQLLASGNNTNGILNVGANSLIVNGNSNIDITSGNNNTTLQIGVNGGLFAGTIEFKGDVSLGVTDNNWQVAFCGNVNSKIIFRGNLIMGAAAFINATNRPGLVEFDGAGTQSITSNDYRYIGYFNNVVIGNTNNPTVNLIAGLDPIHDDLVGNLTVNGSSTLNLGTLRWNRLTTGGALTLKNTATLKLAASSGGQIGSNFPLNFSTYDFSPTSSVEYTGTVNQTIYDVPVPGYGNLTTTNNSIKTAGGGLDIRGNLLINNTSTFAGSTLSHNIAGNWINNGTFTIGTSTIVFNGTDLQNIQGTNATTFNNLTINNTSGVTTGVTLMQPTSVAGICNFIAGLITSSYTNLLIFNDNATTINANNNVGNPSFTNGPVKKIGNDVFAFPVGKLVGGYHYLTISAPSNTTDEFVCEYLRANARLLGPITDPLLVRVSMCEYWILNKISAASASINVTLSWNSLSPCTPSYINDPPTLTVANFDGSNWSNHGVTPPFSGNNIAGTITRNGVSSFGSFTLGSTNVLMNILPVSLFDLQLQKNKDGISVNWKNTKEEKVAYYQVMRSTNGKDFISVGILNATQNNGNEAHYNFIDRSATQAVYYYRIKLINNENDQFYSNTAKINLESRVGSINILSNPLTDHRLGLQLNDLPTGTYNLTLLNSSGQVVYKNIINHKTGSSTYSMQLSSSLTKGIYYLQISTSDSKFSRSILIQ